MKKLLLRLFILTAACLCCSYRGLSQDIHFTFVDPPKDASWTSIHGMTQDQQGFIWFATKEGLYKYDGHQYKPYLHSLQDPNSLAFNYVESICADKRGFLWIGTFGGGLDKLDPLTGVFTHYRHQSNNKSSLRSDTVTAIIADHEGMLWIGTYQGLEEFNPKTGVFTHFSHRARDSQSLSNNQVRVIYEDKKGVIWVGTGSVFLNETPKGEGGLNKFDRKTRKFTRYLHNDRDLHSLIDNRVRAIFEDNRGAFWVGTAGDGLHTMDRKTGRFERHPYNPAHPEKLSRPPLKKTLTYADDQITFINQDTTGRIWIGTLEGGINIYDPATKKTTWYGADRRNKESLAGDGFWYACKTRDGVMWVASWDGIELYKVNPYENRLPYNSTGSGVYSFETDTGNATWIGTAGGLIYEAGDNTIHTFYIDKNHSSKNNIIDFVAKGADKKLWVISGGKLYRFDPGSKIFTPYNRRGNRTTSFISDSVICVLDDGPGKLWIGTKSGLILTDTKAGTSSKFGNEPTDTTTISDNFINALSPGVNNELWLATEHGVDKLDRKSMRFKRYLTDRSFGSVLCDQRGNVWAASDKNFYKYDRNKDSFSIFGPEGLEAYWITEDHEGNLWLNTEKGILKLDPANADTKLYGKDEGVPGHSLFAGYTRGDGQILYGNKSGYFAFYPDKLLNRYPAPAIVIHHFFLADKPVQLDKPVERTNEIHLNHKQSTFSFGFTILDFVSEPGTMQSFYMLENYDSQWRKANPDETANYYNIPPGPYIFKIKTQNYNGLVTVKSIAIIIYPPWWQNWWAYAIFALLIGGSIWLFIYIRSLQHIKEKRVLEHKVHIRTEQVLAQKEEIESQRDNLEKAFYELKATQDQLIQSEKMASLGELTAGIAHEIQNPLNFVNNFSEVNREMIDELKEELNNGKINEALAIANDIQHNEDKINHHGKRADAIVKNMLQHSRTNSSQKDLTDINVLADEYMRLAYHGLRAKDKDFTAELVTHFDEALPKIDVIPQDISRALLNLFNNAFFAVNQKQKALAQRAVGTGAGYEPEVSVTTSFENGKVIIIIKDNGVGIPDAIKDKVMQPFFTTKPTGEGTGLGLSLTYDIIVKAHGGKLKMESKPGEYTQFTVTLPLN